MAKVRIKRLRVAFTSEAAFLAEYTNNIANGGIFLATRKAFSVRDPVHVEVRLDYCDEVVTLRGEVVHTIPAEMASTGAAPGVAVQFADEGHELREKFGALVGDAAPANEESKGGGRREADRTRARVTAGVRSQEAGDFAARTRDISKTGVLISTGGVEVPVGQSLSVDLTHPISGEQMSVDGKVVRQVCSDDGTISALGVEFDVAGDRAQELGGFVDRVKQTEHSRRLGIISGTIEGYSTERLLRMFSGVSPSGTMSVMRKGEEGAIIFNESGFVAAYVGRLTDRQALAEMLMWRDGDFEFETAVEPVFRDYKGQSLDKILEEVKETSARGIPKATKSSQRSAPSLLDARIHVDLAALDGQTNELSKSEEALIDLAIVGASVRKAVQLIPEPDDQILRAIESLIERGLVRIDP